MFRYRISWRAVVAGVVTAFAVSVVMAVLGVALGFSVVSPLSSEPFSGLGAAFGIWSILSVVVSLAAGGYMAGFVAPGRGAEHGFLTWATALLIAGYIGGQAVGSAVDTVGTAVRGVGSAAATVASGVGGGVADLAGSAVDAVHDELADLDIDTGEIQGDVAQVLRDTEVPTLQPEYIRDQMRAARADLRSAVHQISLDSDNFDSAVGGFLERQHARLESIAGDVDREAAVTALMNNRDVSRPEAEDMVDNALAVYSGIADRARDALQSAQTQLEETRAYVADAVRQARLRADELASTVARSSLLAGLALLAGAALAALAGWYGRGCAIRRFRDDALVESTTITTGVLRET